MMKNLLNSLKATIYLPFATLLLLFGFTPVQNVHAGGMNHDMNSISKSATNCCTSSSTSAVLSKRQKAPNRDEDEDPKPPEQIPYYTQFQQFTESPKPHIANTDGARLLRPPDIIKLYNNFRL